jgi:hypothetical protein
MVVVPAAIAPAQLVGKDPDSLMVVTRAFSGKVESGSASDDHHLIVRASSRKLLLK